MQWQIRMIWCTVATLDILHQGDTLQPMGTKKIMVGHGQHGTLVSTEYGKILQTPADECIEWYASVIKKLGKTGQHQSDRRSALETLLHCRRQQLIRMAASRGGTPASLAGVPWHRRSRCPSRLNGVTVHYQPPHLDPRRY